MVFLDDDGGPPSNRDILVHPRNERVVRSSQLHAHVDTMSYPLLFPTGTPLGWTTTLEHSETDQSAARKRTKVTLIQRESHQRVRGEEKSILPHAGDRLFQQ